MMLFLLVLLAHVLADFVFQSEATALQKGKGKTGGYFSHAFFVLIITFIFLLPYEGLENYILAIVIAVIHFLIDWLKYFMNRLFKRFGRDISIASFVFDQLLHVVSILILVEAFVPGEREFMLDLQSRLPDLNLYLITIIVYIYVVFGGRHFIRVLLDAIPSFHNRKWREEKESGELIFKSKEETNKGMFIGILERAMVLTLWITGNPGAIGFVLTAKSIARFKEFDDREFAEYYLIGTLASMLLAVIGGIVLNWVYG